MIVKTLVWYLCLKIAWGFPDSFTGFPNPQTQYRTCGRQKASHVCDPEFVLELGEAEKLDQLAQELKVSTSCLCSSCPADSGISVGIFIKNNVIGISESDLSGKELAETIRKEWNLGTCDDDITILLITESNLTDFSLGASVQKVLPEKTAAQIVNDCRIHFDSGYFYQGLESIVNSFNDVIIKEQKKNVDEHNDLYLGLSVGFAALILLLICLIIIHVRQRRRRKRRCSNVYQTDSIKRNQKNLPDDDKDQLEKLNIAPNGNQTET